MHDFIVVTPAPCGVLPLLCACALVVLTSPFDPHSTLFVTPLADQYRDVPADQDAIAPFNLRAPVCSCAAGIVIVLYRNPLAGSRALCVVFVAAWSYDITKYERA